MVSTKIHRRVKKDVFPKFILTNSCCGGKNVVDDNTNHRGARMVFLIMNSIVNLKEHQNVDDDHDTFVERFHEDVIDRR